MKYDIIIIGAGPGGIFSAYELVQQNPDLKIAVFEAGHPLEKRHCPIDGDKIKSCINCKSCSIMSGFGGAGAFSGEKKDNGGGGMAGKMTPCAVLVIQNGTTKLVNVKNQDGLTKILDMVPDFVDRFTSGKGDEESVGESEK